MANTRDHISHKCFCQVHETTECVFIILTGKANLLASFMTKRLAPKGNSCFSWQLSRITLMKKEGTNSIVE